MTNQKKVSVQDFLEANLEDFRYEKSGIPNRYWLFHCRENGGCRFSLFFGPDKKTNDKPLFLKVSLSNIDIDKSDFIVNLTEPGKEYYVPEDAKDEDLRLLEKICQILNSHKVHNSYVPL